MSPEQRRESEEKHRGPAKPEREHQEELIDEGLDESFPASDPPSSTPTHAGKPKR